MVEQVSSENTKRPLLEGRSGPTPHPRPNPNRQHRAGGDVVVENATEKRYLWTARAFAIVFAVSLCCNMILLYVIVAIMPLYRVVPFLMSFEDKSEQIYKIIPVNNIYDQKHIFFNKNLC